MLLPALYAVNDMSMHGAYPANQLAKTSHGPGLESDLFPTLFHGLGQDHDGAPGLESTSSIGLAMVGPGAIDASRCPWMPSSAGSAVNAGSYWDPCNHTGWLGARYHNISASGKCLVILFPMKPRSIRPLMMKLLEFLNLRTVWNSVEKQ